MTNWAAIGPAMESAHVRILSQRIDRSGASSTALSGFELEFQLDIGEDGLERALECGAIVPFSIRQID